jgi:hypothetical protein
VQKNKVNNHHPKSKVKSQNSKNRLLEPLEFIL